MQRTDSIRLSKEFFLKLAFELVVIVAGILLALAIDSWQSERADRRLEREYLDRMVSDLKRNIQRAEYNGEYQDSIVEYGNRVLPLIKSGIRTDDTPLMVAAYAYWASAVAPPDWFDVTHVELVSAGRYGIIADSTLRTALLEYFEITLQGDQVFALASTDYRERIRRKFDSNLQIFIRTNCDRLGGTCIGSPADSELEGLIQWLSDNEPLAQGLSRAVAQSSRASSEYAAVVEEHSRILVQRLEAELESH